MWTENWSTLSDTVSCGGRVSGLRDLSVTCADRQFDFAAVASIVLSLQFSDSNYLNLYTLCPISTLRVCIARSTNAKALKLAWLCVKRAAAKSISMLKHELRAAVRFRILPFPMRWPVCFLHILATFNFASCSFLHIPLWQANRQRNAFNLIGTLLSNECIISKIEIIRVILRLVRPTGEVTNWMGPCGRLCWKRIKYFCNLLHPGSTAIVALVDCRG